MLILILTIIISILFIYLIYKACKKNTSSNSMDRFRQKLTSPAHTNQRIFERYAEYLSGDPYQNINLTEWEREGEILEKVNIHKARLNKYGKSKLNGQIFYLDKKGSIYTISKEGYKDFV